MKEVNTTNRDFETFKKEARKWIELNGLGDWDIVFEHRTLEENNAQCNYNCGQRFATLSLNKTISVAGMTKAQEVLQCARHEVGEVKYSILRSMALSSIQQDHIVDSEIHALINREERIYASKQKS